MNFFKKNRTKCNKNKILTFSFSKIAIASLLTLSSVNTMALDTTLSLHQGDESKTSGISIALADTFTKGSNVYWSVGYSTLDDVKVEWNDDELFFKNDAIDVVIGYRHKIVSYNSFFKKITLDFQAGASYALTDNKFFWEDLNEEKYFSESGDINAIVAMSAHYNFNKKTALTVGIKHQPSLSDFGSVSSVFIGINYKFGRATGY
jgi:hypothetical protein